MPTDDQIARDRQRVYGAWRANMRATSLQLDGLLVQWRACNGDDTPLPEWWAPLVMCAVKLNRVASGRFCADSFADCRNYLCFVEAMQREQDESLRALGAEIAAEMRAPTMHSAEWLASLGLGDAPAGLWEELRPAMVAAARAAETSPDPSTRNGAAVVTAGGVRTGCNRPVVPCDVERLTDRAWKLAVTRHAEECALDAAGAGARGAPMCALWAACPACARAIVAAGVETLVVSRGAMEATPPDWRAEVELGLAVLRGAGVEVLAAPPVGLEMLVRGERVGV